jgi:hypothetical protein
MGYVPPKGPPRRSSVTMIADSDPTRWEFVITPKGWWHLFWNCTNMKKCKMLGAVQ